MRESKKSEGGGAFKAPPDRIGLNIVCFHKVGFQRVSLNIFSNDMGLVPKLISQLFTKNNEYYDYNTLHLSVGRSGAIYRYSSFHRNNIWNFVKYMYPLMYHICVLKN